MKAENSTMCVCVSVCDMYMCVCTTCVQCIQHKQSPEEGNDPLELELWAGVSHLLWVLGPHL